MLKKIKSLLLIVTLVMIFTMQLGTEAEGGYPYISYKFGFDAYTGSLCVSNFDLRQLSRVEGEEDVILYATFYDFSGPFDGANPAGNSDTAQGTWHSGDITLAVEHPVDPLYIVRNGVYLDAVVCLEEDDLSELEDTIALELPNPGWDVISYEIYEFKLELVLWVVDLGVTHTVEVLFTSDDGVNFDFTILYDSRL